MNDANEAAQTPATILMVVGALFAAFYGIAALWNGFGVLMGCLGVSGMALDNHSSAAGIGFGVWGLAISGLTLVVYLGLAAAGAFVVTGGLAFKDLKEMPKVQRSVMLAAAIPIVGLVVSIGGSVVSLNCCALVTGAVPHLVMTGLGVGAMVFANQALQDDAVVAGFQD